MNKQYSPPAQTQQEMAAQIVSLRRALQTLISATASVATQRAINARAQAARVWRESLNAQERQEYLAKAQEQDPSLTDFETAIESQGNWLAYELQNQGLIG